MRQPFCTSAQWWDTDPDPVWRDLHGSIAVRAQVADCPGFKVAASDGSGPGTAAAISEERVGVEDALLLLTGRLRDVNERIGSATDLAILEGLLLAGSSQAATAARVAALRLIPA